MMKSLKFASVSGERFGQELESHGLAEFQIISPIDFTHSALAKQTDDAITLSEHGPGCKPGLIDRI